MSLEWEVRLNDPRRLRRRRMLLVLLLLAVPLAFVVGWFMAAQQRPDLDSADGQATLVRLAEQEQELELLRQRLAVVASSEKVGQQSIEQNRRTIKLLEEQIFKQQQDLAFYKGVLAPGSRKEGLRIRTLELQATETPGRYRYKLLLSRVGDSETPLQGQLRITVEGRQGDKDISYELSALTEEVDDASIPFSLKHFQSLPEAGRFGEMVLPEGFEPRQVKVSAQVEGEKPLDRTFEWISEE